MALKRRRLLQRRRKLAGARDLITVVDKAMPTTHFYTVLSNMGSVVDVANVTTVAETDGD